MPEIPQYRRQQRMTTSAGSPDIGYLDAAVANRENREIARAGQMMTHFGAEMADKFNRAEAVSQLNTFQADTLREVYAYQRNVDPNTDRKTYTEGMRKILDSRREAAGKLGNVMARDRAGQWFMDFDVQAVDQAEKEGNVLFAKQERARLELNVNNLSNEYLSETDPNKKMVIRSHMEKMILQAGGEGIETDGVSLFNKAESELMRNETFAKLDIAEAKQQAERTVNYAYQTGYGILDNGGTVDEAKTAVKKILPESQWDEVFRDFDYYQKDRKAEQEAAIKGTREQIGVGLFKSIQSKDLVGARKLLKDGMNGVLLEPTGENGMASWQKAIDEASKPTAITSDDTAWKECADAVRMYKSGKMNDDDAYGVLVKNKSKLSAGDYGSLRGAFDNLPTMEKPRTSPEQQIIAKGYRDALEKVHYSTKTEEQREKMSKALIAFDLFGTKPHTKDEYQALMDNIFDNIEDNWFDVDTLSDKGFTSFTEQAESGSESEVKIKDKAGNTYFIPESQLQQALDSGEYEEAK